MKSYVLTVSCKSTRGIVAAITGYLADKGCYIVDSSQFDDLGTGLFFMRLTFTSQEGATMDEITAALSWQAHTARGAMSGALGKKLGLVVTSAKEENRGRVYRLGMTA